MKKIIKGRQTGKTTELIKLSEATGHYIMTSTKARASCVFKLAEEMKCNILYPITVEEYFRSGGMKGSFIKDILIDDADDVLQTVFRNVNIEAIAMTGEYENVLWKIANVLKMKNIASNTKVSLIENIVKGESDERV